jgi:hypothetical protein
VSATNLSDEQQRALDAFDAARDAFLPAFAQAPDEALAYVPAGDEYAVGTLLPHIRDTITHYLGVLGLIREAGFGPVDLSADPSRARREEQQHLDLVALRPTGADRARLLGELAAAHQSVHVAVSALDGAEYGRQAPVVFSAGTDAFPTSCRDIMGWITEHYDEHTAQVTTMIAGWWHARQRPSTPS